MVDSLQREVSAALSAEVVGVRPLGGGDVAEPFSVKTHEDAEPGMVLSICADAPGELEISSEAYDRKVAGVVSGAGDLNPGIILNKSAQDKGRRPVALTGQVYCWAETFLKAY